VVRNATVVHAERNLYLADANAFRMSIQPTVIDRPFRILQTCFSPSWGGLEIQAMEVTQKLQERGHRVWLASLPGSRLADEASVRGLSLLPLDARGYFHPAIIWRLARFLREEKVDIVHCQLSRDIATIVPAVKLSRRRIPIILSKRVGSYINKKDLFHRLTYAHVAMAMSISSVIHKNVLDTTPLPPERVMTLHDAIDVEHFSPARVDPLSVRKALGISPSSVVIGFVGRFSPGKGHEEFIEAARTLAATHPNVHFLIVGEASRGEEAYADRIRKSAKGLEGRLTFAGYRRDIPAVMAAFDIFAFPSHAESFGVVLIEAMAMERPVVSTNCDGVLDIVVDGETGLYVHPRNAEELATALARLIEDPLLRQRMGKAGRKRVEELFDQRKQITMIEEVYRTLLLSSLTSPTRS
jgi:glycosyltransferase involved in cell wall biosynthesis